MALIVLHAAKQNRDRIDDVAMRCDVAFASKSEVMRSE